MNRIIIDAGHGPQTAGKQSPDGSLKEFMFNSRVADMVKEILLDRGISTIFTHDINRDVPLNERIKLANQLKGTAFISIHANAFGTSWNDANGIETYVYVNPMKASKDLAQMMQASMVHTCERRDRGVKYANFAVLRETKMPAILIECGFMTNKEECQLLKSESYRKKCANAIVFSIQNWMSSLKS